MIKINFLALSTLNIHLQQGYLSNCRLLEKQLFTCFETPCKRFLGLSRHRGLLNKGRKIEIEYEEIFQNDISKQLKISKIFFQNLEERVKQRVKNEQTKVSHEIQQCDPLSSLTECTVMDYK